MQVLSFVKVCRFPYFESHIGTSKQFVEMRTCANPSFDRKRSVSKKPNSNHSVAGHI